MSTPVRPASRRITAGPSILQGVPATRFDLRPVYEPLIFLALTSVAYFVMPANMQYILSVAVIYALLATSLGVLFGWTGTYTFGHAAFFGMGAYTTALLKDQAWGPLAFLGVSAVVAAVGSILIGLIGQRLAKVEFAMLTMIVGQIAYLLTFRVPVLQGDNGIYGIPRGEIFGVDLTLPTSFWWYSIIVIAVVMGILRRIHLSSFGESLNAVRDDPVKAAAIGIPVKSLRLAAFTLAGMIAGLAGGLFAQQGSIVTPTTLSFTFSGQIIIMALLGGMMRFWGPAVGAILFQFINALVFGNSPNGTLVLGAILLAVVLLFPSGVLGVLSKVRDLAANARRRR
ncbi:branched-chain amino acid ABC transporter permease [Diaminobutyricimonas sp. LJ205]|uniref:branched-chain amino acid ABC transporter permease n=1 Tax=Diaminobutyricimonas sp. LJ205 TaxID=2683590 RepID=UPI0012F47DEE|nr:branched-chain amino acid ABC transporter permease [Diaminobutyricimonas sp. LJ205]